LPFVFNTQLKIKRFKDFLKIFFSIVTIYLCNGTSYSKLLDRTPTTVEFISSPLMSGPSHGATTVKQLEPPVLVTPGP
jgi:hypothetical protein